MADVSSTKDNSSQLVALFEGPVISAGEGFGFYTDRWCETRVRLDIMPLADLASIRGHFMLPNSDITNQTVSIQLSKSYLVEGGAIAHGAPFMFEAHAALARGHPFTLYFSFSNGVTSGNDKRDLAAILTRLAFIPR